MSTSSKLLYKFKYLLLYLYFMLSMYLSKFIFIILRKVMSLVILQWLIMWIFSLWWFNRSENTLYTLKLKVVSDSELDVVGQNHGISSTF